MWKLVASFLLFVLVGCAGSKNLALLKSSANDLNFVFTGRIDQQSYRNIIDVINAHPHQKITIHANSNGGYIDGILEAMDAIHQHGQVIWNVSQYDKCVSACAVLGMSAKHINGKLSFHSVYTRYDAKSYKLLGNNDEIQQRLIGFGYDAQLIKQIFLSINIYRSIEFLNGKITVIN